MKNPGKLLVFLSLAATTTASSIDIPLQKDDYYWSLKVGKFHNEDNAIQLATSLSGFESESTDIYYDGKSYNVYIGNYSNAISAQHLANLISKNSEITTPSLFKRKITKDSHLSSLGPIDKNILDIKNENSQPKITNNIVLNYFNDIKAIDTQRLYPAVRNSLESQTSLVNIENKENLTADELALYNLAANDKKLVAGDMSASESISFYSDLATTTTEISQAIRLIALKSKADVLHYYKTKKSDKIESFLSYNNLANYAKDASQLDFYYAALLEMSGVMMEQAQSGLGHYQDAMTLCQFIKNSTDDTNRFYHTAQLMQAEIWHFRKNYSQAEIEFEKLNSNANISKFPREFSMGLYFQAINFKENKKYNDALQICQKLIRLDIPNNEIWFYKNNPWNMKLRGLNLIAVVYSYLGDTRECEKYRNLLITEQEKWGRKVY